MSQRRPVLVGLFSVAHLVGLQSPAAAHGIGGRADLPVPLGWFLVGAGLVLVVSFVALGVLWKTPRLQSGSTIRRIRIRLNRKLTLVANGVAVFFLLLVIVAGLFGVQNGTRNVAPATVWVVFWLVLPFAAALLGNLYTLFNPWRPLARAVWSEVDEKPHLVERFGVIPAALALFAFTWLELVWPDSGRPSTLAVAAVIYTIYLLTLSAWLGPDTAMLLGDSFTTYHRVLSAIAPLGRTQDGAVHWRGWLRALPALPEWKGLTLFVTLMIGTVSYDGLSATSWWRDRLGSASGEVWAETLGMIAICSVIGGAYWLASWAAVRMAGSYSSPTEVAASFAHTLVPIALAYAFAHYFTLVLFEGQLFVATISDPLGRGWNLFGTAGREISYWMSPEAVWYVQLATILLGHIVGVVLAHDRALALFPERSAVRSQYAMLVLMVLLTALGLSILAAG